MLLSLSIYDLTKAKWLGSEVTFSDCEDTTGTVSGCEESECVIAGIKWIAN
ncbi:hypothetical protein RJD38_11525 [Vibrio scophthalmi]|uniref:Uncharacterized protein n=1 Tax=Vibrio scophthalmi TaxID=45658 RepID=A0A1C7FAR8_9VIBR|nr:hypothetical protein [Vibrio scophthalmi]ANU36961.1 hypothetical protein VSVS05_01836 [Vibrio scophthalmi]